MKKIFEALDILKQLDAPKKQQNERSALTLLALLSLGNKDVWSSSKKTLIRIHDIMIFIKKRYNKAYAENSRETIRRQTLHQFEKEVGIVERNSDDLSRPTNSPNTTWSVTDDALEAIKKYGTEEWRASIDSLMKKLGKKVKAFDKNRRNTLLKLRIGGKEYQLSLGKHNELQIDIVTTFKAHFCKDAKVLYPGDTAHKMLFLDKTEMKAIGIEVSKHDILPDIVLLDQTQSRLYLIEAVTSHGPVSNKRLIELNEYFSEVRYKKIFVSAFPDLKEFKRHVDDLAWETEVWIAEIPEHMIHFNGDKFLKAD